MNSIDTAVVAAQTAARVAMANAQQAAALASQVATQLALSTQRTEQATISKEVSIEKASGFSTLAMEVQALVENVTQHSQEAITAAGIASDQAVSARQAEANAANSASAAIAAKLSAQASATAVSDGVATATAQAALTAADALSTAADRVQTALDRTAVATNAGAAATSAQTATTQAEIANSAAVLTTSQVTLATAQLNAATANATTATTKAGEAAASAANALTYSNTATTQAGSVTTQAGIATDQAVIANTQAGIATSAANAAALSAQNATTSASTASNQVTLATVQAGIATTQASLAATQANLAITNATTATNKAALTAADRVQTSLDAATAAVAATAAYNSAVSASSVLQQDLSQVIASLHKSPNAVTALFLYDTSKDSDGGAWTEKCQNTSWYNEPLNGAWLNAQINEFAARGDNLLSYPEDFTQAAWTRSNATVVKDGTLAPDGTATANLITSTAASGDSMVTFASGITGADGWTTVYAKRSNNDWVALSNASHFAYFNLAAGSIGSSGGGAISIDLIANGWYRLKWQQQAVNRMAVRLRLASSNGVCTSNPVGQSAYFWGAKANNGLLATDYVPHSVQAGQYFQLTTDGKHYKLTSTYGTITEVFRGNKAKFPRLAAIVVEATSITIYDLTEAGRPMWMRFVQGTGLVGICSGFGAAISAVNVSAINSLLAVAHGSLYMGVTIIDFSKDTARRHRENTTANGSSGYWQRDLANRNNSVIRYDGATAGNLVNPTVNAIAMTILPDAPTDIITGLKVPTIAVATLGGISVIRHNGTVINSDRTDNYSSISFDKANLIASFWYGVIAYNTPTTGQVGSMAAVFEYNISNTFTGLASSNSIKKLSNNVRIISPYNTPEVTILLENKEKLANRITAKIKPNYSTGYLLGDIRRCYLADSMPGSVTAGAVQLVTSSSAETNWTANGGGSFTSNGAGGYLGFSNTLYTGKSYKIEFTISAGSTGLLLGWLDAAWDITWSGATGSFSVTKTIVTVGNRNPTFYSSNFAGTISNIVISEVEVDRSYKLAFLPIYGTLTKSLTANANQLVAYSGFTAVNYLQEAYSADLDFSTGEWSISAWVSYSGAVTSIIASRAHSSQAYTVLGTDAAGKLTAAAYDGATTRTVVTSAAYNTSTFIKVVANYRAGRLAIEVNGVEVASSNGAPLLTMNNSSAVLTIGNSYALDAPFPGSIALLKLGATVPTPEQSLFMYEQEKAMFRDGAQVTLPTSNPVVDLAYDETTDTWRAVQDLYESDWNGLVRTAILPPSSGSFTKVESKAGIKILARSGNVDLVIPAQGLRDEFLRRGENAARLAKPLQVFDFDTASFTATTTNGSNVLTSIASIVGTVYIGMGITGTNIPVGTTIAGINGTTYYLSANATGAGTTLAMGQSTFTLPAGWTITEVIAASASKREGATKDWVRLYDGFRETIRFAVAPASAAWVQITARKDNY